MPWLPEQSGSIDELAGDTFEPSVRNLGHLAESFQFEHESLIFLSREAPSAGLTVCKETKDFCAVHQGGIAVFEFLGRNRVLAPNVTGEAWGRKD